MTVSSRTLKIDVNYGGGAFLTDLMTIDEVTVNYDGISVTNKLVNPIEIKGPKEIVIPINNPDKSQHEKQLRND